MFANYLIGLREGLEAALVVGILVAYLVKAERRELLTPIWIGVGIAISISVGFGALLTYGPRGMSFEAKETLGGTLSIIAVGFVTWMIFWMARTARSIKGDLEHRMDTAMAAGSVSLVLLAVFAVGREGLETALFLWAAAQATGETTQPLIGTVLGLGTAVVLGVLIYKGAVKLNMAKFFTWTGAALVVVAAGVLAYGVHDLQEAGVLPGLNNLAFDVSEQIPPGSWYGTLLKGTINFSPATTVLEALVWVLYLVPVMFLFLRTVRGPKAPKHAATAPKAAMAAVALLVVIPLVSCTDKADDGGDAIEVSSTADACELSATEAPAGTVVFDVRNDGTEVTEFYLLSQDASEVLGEIENIGPGVSRTFSIDASVGTYTTACKPGMVGDGIQAPFTVTE